MSNCINVIGRLTKDPELKGEGEKSYWYLSLADNQREKTGDDWKDAPQYFNSFCSHTNPRPKNLSKGDLLSIWGTLKVRKNDENEVSGVTINIDRLEKILGKSDDSGTPVAASSKSSNKSKEEDDYDPFDD